ncbi:MAG: hypothetical protein JOZ92_00115 [Candidatus Dormibacteraeota bacterium]|nr:hypothetical protein [Candidatus Dormibacteraeota bacterium]
MAVQVEPELTTDGVIEVLGRLVGTLGVPDTVADSNEVTLRSLRALALDNLVDVIRLREQIAERDTRIVELRQDVAAWMDRTRTLSVTRTAEKAAAHQRERELVTVLHQTITENTDLRAELEWRRKPWWRRGRRPEPAVTPAQLLASAPR